MWRSSLVGIVDTAFGDGVDGFCFWTVCSHRQQMHELTTRHQASPGESRIFATRSSPRPLRRRMRVVEA